MNECPHRKTYRNRRGIIRCSDCREVIDRPGADVVVYTSETAPELYRPPAEPLTAYRETILARTLQAHPDAAEPQHAVYLNAYVDAAARAEALSANLDEFGIDGERGGVRSPALSAARLNRQQAVDLYGQLVARLTPTHGRPMSSEQTRAWIIDRLTYPPRQPLDPDAIAVLVKTLNSTDIDAIEHSDAAVALAETLVRQPHVFCPVDQLPYTQRGDGRVRVDQNDPHLARARDLIGTLSDADDATVRAWVRTCRLNWEEREDADKAAHGIHPETIVWEREMSNRAGNGYP